MSCNLVITNKLFLFLYMSSRNIVLFQDVTKMTLSTSRQQFLAYETQPTENIQYGRKGGVFISHCVCVGFVLFAILLALIVGVIAHFITYFKVSWCFASMIFHHANTIGRYPPTRYYYIRYDTVAHPNWNTFAFGSIM